MLLILNYPATLHTFCQRAVPLTIWAWRRGEVDYRVPSAYLARKSHHSGRPKFLYSVHVSTSYTECIARSRIRYVKAPHRLAGMSSQYHSLSAALSGCTQEPIRRVGCTCGHYCRARGDVQAGQTATKGIIMT
jgi:hypothetical protein